LNHIKTTWVLKCDIRKFFASVDQRVLLNIVKVYIPDSDIFWLITQIVTIFHSTKSDVGLPLGNLTSQLLVNVYMNEFDQFIKHKLKIKYYIRYADDFLILSRDKSVLKNLLPQLQLFLHDRLRLQLHPNKISIRTVSSGVDYLGWILFPDYRILRSVTKKRMLSSIKNKQGKEETVQSYLGILKHVNGIKIRKKVDDLVEDIKK